ncbi:MAG TPA: VWA domain-containing protein [Candidatus Dormibacteraeota bacterium]|nr:VWA domain-containing protein [Candidatus Dormibacteraeota bacterium]
MKKGYSLFFAFAAVVGSALFLAAQQTDPGGLVIHKVVAMVQLNVAVTDRRGRYVTNLKPSDFEITEDGIPETIATFGEGNQAAKAVYKFQPGAGAAQITLPGSPADGSPADGSHAGGSRSLAAPVSPLAGASVFILFDTSDYMFPHRGFVYAQDSIAQFVRSLDSPDRIAFYSYSRNLTRAARLTTNREAVLEGVRSTIDGDDAALYDALLLTLRDASQYTGRKVIVVFSNGPDDASAVSPEDVGELAQSEGIPIYMVSTVESKLDPVSAAVFSRISASTGGEAFFTRSWKDQRQSFAAIQEDLAHLYLITYYPQPNSNTGWRRIQVTLKGKAFKGYHIRTRSGYRPLPADFQANIRAVR